MANPDNQSFNLGFHAKESWELLRKNMLSIVLIHLSLIVVSVLALLLFAGGIFAYIWQNQELVQALKNFSREGFEGFKDVHNYIQYVQILAVMGAAYGIIASLAGFVSQATIILLTYATTPVSWFAVLKQALRIAPLLFLTAIVTGLLTLGGYVLFILPGLAITLFVVFASYETIIHKKTPFAAISRSTQLVGAHFSLVLGRVLLFFVVSLAIPIFLQNLSHIKSMEVLMNILYVLANIFISWFGIMYLVVLYKHLESNTSQEAKTNPLWMYIVSLVGWAFLGLILYFLAAKYLPIN